jgi:hypothetical protein
MKLKDLKQFILQISDEMDDFEIVNGEGTFNSDDGSFIMVNNDVVTVYIDKHKKEIQFLHQTEEDIREILNGL